jgi:hypothetical protein
MDGYAPIFAYLGEEGYLVHCELREGKQHCQDGTPKFLDESLNYAEQITRAKLLVRSDSGNDAIENIKVCRKHKADWIIKRNLRKESLEDWLEEAQAHGDWEFPREGKEVYTGETWRERDGKLYRVVFEVIRRTIAADGQKLLIPDIEVNTWWTSLRLSAKEVIALYHAHGTSEQYHSEIKTDLDMERLPSGKFANQRHDALAGSGGVQCSAAVRPGRVARAATAGTGGASTAAEESLPAAVAERDPRLDVSRGAAGAARQPLAGGFWQNSPWGATWHGLYARFCGARCVRSG